MTEFVTPIVSALTCPDIFHPRQPFVAAAHGCAWLRVARGALVVSWGQGQPTGHNAAVFYDAGRARQGNGENHKEHHRASDYQWLCIVTITLSHIYIYISYFDMHWSTQAKFWNDSPIFQLDRTAYHMCCALAIPFVPGIRAMEGPEQQWERLAFEVLQRPESSLTEESSALPFGLFVQLVAVLSQLDGFKLNFIGLGTSTTAEAKEYFSNINVDSSVWVPDVLEDLKPRQKDVSCALFNSAIVWFASE